MLLQVSIHVAVPVPSLTDADEPLSYFNIKDLCISNNNITFEQTGKDTAQKTSDKCVTMTGSLQSTTRKEEYKKNEQVALDVTEAAERTNQKCQETSQST